MEVELRIAESIGKAGAARHNFRPEHPGVEIVRTRPIGHVHDTVIELHVRRHKVPVVCRFRCNNSGNPALLEHHQEWVPAFGLMLQQC